MESLQPGSLQPLPASCFFYCGKAANVQQPRLGEQPAQNRAPCPKPRGENGTERLSWSPAGRGRWQQHKHCLSSARCPQITRVLFPELVSMLGSIFPFFSSAREQQILPRSPAPAVTFRNRVGEAGSSRIHASSISGSSREPLLPFSRRIPARFPLPPVESTGSFSPLLPLRVISIPSASPPGGPGLFYP